MKKLGIALFVLLIILGIGTFVVIKQQNVNNSKPTPTTTPQKSATIAPSPSGTPLSKSMEKPQLTIDKNKKYTAFFKTTEGDIKISLNAAQTPITVNNFIYLARAKFYDNTIFHRVIDGFMIQGGDPEGTGRGGPGYRFDDEPFAGEYRRGTIAMANAGPDTNGSQFFIMHKDYPLPKNYVIFGNVIEGIEAVDKIATAPTTTSMGGEKSKPVNPAKIISVEIIEE